MSAADGEDSIDDERDMPAAAVAVVPAGDVTAKVGAGMVTIKFQGESPTRRPVLT